MSEPIKLDKTSNKKPAEERGTRGAGEETWPWIAQDGGFYHVSRVLETVAMQSTPSDTCAQNVHNKLIDGPDPALSRC